MNFKLFFFILFFLDFKATVYTQNKSDSLLHKTYEELLNDFKKSKNTVFQRIYLDAYIEKARNTNDTTNIVEGFSRISELSTNVNTSIKFLDSIILFTKDRPNELNPAGAYLKKGNHYIKKNKNFKLALDNFLKANAYSKRFFNKEFYYTSNHMVGILKDRIGYSKEALEIHKSNLDLVQKEFEKPFKSFFEATSLHAIAFTYKNLGVLDSAMYYNNQSKLKAIELGHEPSINAVLLNEGIIEYHRSRFNEAELVIQKSLKYFKKNQDKANMAEAYFYLGKIYYDRNQKIESINLLKEMDSIFLQTNDLLPEAREGYEILTSYYKENNQPQLQLLYLQRLISLDSILNSNTRYLGDNIKKKYDIPKLLQQKELLIDKLKYEKINLKYLFLVVAIILFLIILGMFWRQNQLKKRFNRLLKEEPEKVSPSQEHKKEKVEIDIPENIARDIIKHLEIFKKEQKFTNNKITLSSLAKSYQTNSTYLSKTINYYYEKNFAQYLNDLRIEYALNRLKNDLQFRKYTIATIAKESGFKSSETFSKLFKAKNGIYPSYFIKQLEKL